MRFELWLLAVVSLAPAAATPCTKASSKCTEFVLIEGGPSRSLIYRTFPLREKNANVRRALVVVHGASRDADEYFRSAVAAASRAKALEDTIVIAPRMTSHNGECRDRLAPMEVNYDCSSWRSGGPARSDGKLNSFEFLDELLRQLAQKGVFPNLGVIVLTGHSAGGQVVTRYAMANQVHEKLGVPVRYVVANPSSYAYLDETRPVSGVTCADYDDWPYGLRKRKGYSAGLTDEELRKQVAERPVVYLLGGRDVLPVRGFDSSCSAMAQGPTRLARGVAFAKYVDEKFGARHSVTLVPGCGHDGRCMYTSAAGLPILFPQ